MTLFTAIGAQLRDPAGAAGWAAGHVMRRVNARPNALAIAALDLHPADRVLELGCGPGDAVALMQARTSRGVIHAVDRSTTMLAQAHRRNRAAIRAGRVRLYRATFEQLPFASATLDKVLAVNVAYFWRDAGTVLGEVRRVLRPGGRLVVYVTDAASMRHWRFAGPETHRLFDRDGCLGMLRDGGFGAEDALVRGIRVAPGVSGLVARAVR